MSQDDNEKYHNKDQGDGAKGHYNPPAGAMPGVGDKDFKSNEQSKRKSYNEGYRNSQNQK